MCRLDSKPIATVGGRLESYVCRSVFHPLNEIFRHELRLPAPDNTIRRRPTGGDTRMCFRNENQLDVRPTRYQRGCRDLTLNKFPQVRFMQDFGERSLRAKPIAKVSQPVKTENVVYRTCNGREFPTNQELGTE
jgi:hypothetical protein